MRFDLVRNRVGAIGLLAGWCIAGSLAHSERGGGPTAEPDAKQLIACWELKTYTRWEGGQAGQPYGDGPQGLLMYDGSGLMSVQFMKTGRPKFATGDRWKGTADELKAACEGYFAYYGRYEVHAEQGFVIHHIEGSLLPNWVGVDQKRFYILKGKQITLTTPTTVVDGKEIKTVLTWEKRESNRAFVLPRAERAGDFPP